MLRSRLRSVLPALLLVSLWAAPIAAQGLPVRLGGTPNLTDAPPWRPGRWTPG